MAAISKVRRWWFSRFNFLGLNLELREKGNMAVGNFSKNQLQGSHIDLLARKVYIGKTCNPLHISVVHFSQKSRDL